MNKEKIPKKHKEKKELKQIIKSLSPNRIRNEQVRTFVKGLMIVGPFVLFGILWQFSITKYIALAGLVIVMIYMIGKLADL